MTYISDRIDSLERRLRARTKSDGKPLPGYAENVAAIRAELELLTRDFKNPEGKGNG